MKCLDFGYCDLDPYYHELSPGFRDCIITMVGTTGNEDLAMSGEDTSTCESNQAKRVVENEFDTERSPTRVAVKKRISSKPSDNDRTPWIYFNEIHMVSGRHIRGQDFVELRKAGF